jgi:hypothetical protein
MLSVLSIDWDFFFPSTAAFDWSGSENRFGKFYHGFIWQIRYYQTAFYGPHKDKTAKDVMLPDQGLLNNFWANVFPHGFGNVEGIAITESHQDLYTILNAFGDEYIVWNFDAHHDLGYRQEMGPLDCGNWALCGLKDGTIKEYHLVYPKWRIDEPEISFDKTRLNRSSCHWAKDLQALSHKLPKFDYVFICRSGAWTPAWADDDYIDFIGFWKNSHRSLWNRLFSVKGATKARQFDVEAAERLNRQFETQKESILQKAG